MPLAPFGEVHIAEGAPLDHAATAVPHLLTGKRIPAGKGDAASLPPEEFGQRGKLRSRDIAVEIHRPTRYDFFGTRIALFPQSKTKN